MLWFAIYFTFVPVIGAARSSLSHCIFHKVHNQYEGSCGRILEQEPAISLKSARLQGTGGTWRGDIRPLAVWSGEMTDKEYPRESIELETYAGGVGILRTDFGWLPVTHFALSPTLSFDVDSLHEIAPNKTDTKIVQRAMHILFAASAWNRSDNRKCPARATQWSIYCAMEKATIELTGGADHRRPALEVVRDVIEERTAARNYHHRLMDFNNDRTTHLSDVQNVFKDSIKRMKSSAWLRAHGYSALDRLSLDPAK